MATSLAAQLAVIAASSEHSLNLKAQKARHSKSLIFEPRTAASQSFETVYTLCHEGFQELCLLDGRFLEYRNDIFSEHSRDQDRSQMTAAQNIDLNIRLESFLGLVGGRLRLSPAVKAVEWLIRRFRIQDHNTSVLLLTFLPYHTLPMFANLLSILPEIIPEHYRFLQPYIRSSTNPPRHVLVQAAIRSVPFVTSLNSYVLGVCQARQHYSTLLAFWAAIMVEAVGGMLEKARSGRKVVQRQNQQDVVLRLLPSLNKGLAMNKVPDLRVGCYMLLSVMASKGGLDDKILAAMMEAVVLGWTESTRVAGIVCLSVLAQYRGTMQLSKRLARELLKMETLPSTLKKLSEQRRVDKLATGLCLALVQQLRNSEDCAGLHTIQQIIEEGLLSDVQCKMTFKALIMAASEIKEVHQIAGPYLASTLKSLSQATGRTKAVMQEVLHETEVDVDDLETQLQTSIRPIHTITPHTEDESPIKHEASAPETPISPAMLLSHLPKRTVTESSFLTHKPSHIYDDLCRAFLISVASSSDQDSFDNVPILRRESASNDTLYLTFYMRTWCGPHPVMARVSALHMVTRYLSMAEASGIDFQALIPYAVAALYDISAKVRRASAELIMTLHKLYLIATKDKKTTQRLPRWASIDLYGVGDDARDFDALSADIAIRLLSEVLIPTIEESVLDQRHIITVFERALNGTGQRALPRKSESGKLSQSIRASILSFFSTHAIHTPLLSVKSRLLTCLSQVRSVAGTSKTRYLLPCLEQWLLSDVETVMNQCRNEHLEITEQNNTFLTVITASDDDGVHMLVKIIKGDTAHNSADLINAGFHRLRALWSALKEETQREVAEALMEMAMSQSPNHNEILWSSVEESMAFLRSAQLSSKIFASFFTQLLTAAKSIDVSPAAKRRRTGHGEVAKTLIQDSTQLTPLITKLTFVLQLIDSSGPGSHPELLRDLFNTLAHLQNFKHQVSSELAYLQCLTLDSLLAIMRTLKQDTTLKFDHAAIRVDLVVDCIQKTASAQVQRAALLLIAALADTAPELVLHSVMPIFTFMGSSVLRQNDEYSAYIIDQTIQEVIPPLILSLREEQRDPVVNAAELLLSFVAAFEHVPLHRRQTLFTSFIKTLGPEEFLFAVLAMLVDKYGLSEAIKTFSVALSESFSVEIQLQTVIKLIALVFDILKPKPSYSTTLLGTNEEERSDPHRLATKQLSLLPILLSQNRLVSQTAKLLDRDDMDSSRVRELYAALVENILSLADASKDDKPFQSVCGEVLESLLGLLSTSEFVKSVEGLLDKTDESLRRKILRSLEVRIERESSSDHVSRIAMLGFLPLLTAIVRESKDTMYKRIALTCVDKISEKYGKKDLEAVAAAAATIAGKHCLGQTDSRLRVQALLCLASLVDILQDGIVSVLPTAIPRAVDYMEASLGEEAGASSLHIACYTFVSALADHLPYMVSGSYLIKVLQVSSASAETILDAETADSRTSCLHLMAKKIEARIMFGALEKNWEEASSLGPRALHQYLDVLLTAIDKHSKSVITKNSPLLTIIFRNAFDLRRLWSLSEKEKYTSDLISQVEDQINAVAIKMVYKLNDTTFKPIFINLIEWAATTLPKKNQIGRRLRLLSIYGFLAVFFDNLKSVVTGYSTYFLDNAVQIVNTVDLKDTTSRHLWSRALKTMTLCFEHDQDDFWQSPSHFDVIAPVLCAQMVHASVLPVEEDLIPAIVELATAADSSHHHKELNSAILKHLRSDVASVRLAAVKCQQRLTDRMGEEWLSLLPEMLPFISELQEDDDEIVEKETHRWITKMESVLGESLDNMLQ